MKELSTLNKYLYKYKWRLFAGIISVIIASIFQIFPAKYVRDATNLVAEALKNSNSNSSNEILYNKLFYFSVLILVFSLSRGLFMYFMRQTLVVMSRLIEFDMKNEITLTQKSLFKALNPPLNIADVMQVRRICVVARSNFNLLFFEQRNN